LRANHPDKRELFLATAQAKAFFPRMSRIKPMEPGHFNAEFAKQGFIGFAVPLCFQRVKALVFFPPIPKRFDH